MEQFSFQIIAGIDEAGRGPLAGPVVAAAVMMGSGITIEGIKDSKKLSAKKREDLYQEITQNCDWSVGVVSPEEIDQINILEATKKAVLLASKALLPKVDYYLVDGNMKFGDPKFISIIKGDDRVQAISAASIIAKVTRDRIMKDLALDFSEYFWCKNSGYGTRDHLYAIEKYGITPHHRKSFKPVSNYCV